MTGMKVYHKIHGTGTVYNVDKAKSVITVRFGGNLRKFIYPDAFDGFLTAEDSTVQESLKEDIKRKRVPVSKYVPPRPNPKPSQLHPARKKRQPARKNIIIKCNYCDGGASAEQVGFSGPCSEEIIRYNIQKVKRYWCSNTRSDCARYLFRGCSYQYLQDQMKEEGSLCYESKLLRDWNAFMGWSSDGYTSVKLPSGVRSNSLCVLTTREPDTREEERIVFAVFLVDDHHEGNEYEEGSVSAHPVYRIKLSLNEARKLPLWKYHANKNSPLKPRWGQGLSRSMDGCNAAALLADIVKVKSGTVDEALARGIYSIFCEVNDLDPHKPPEASGALSLIAKAVND